MVNRSLVVKTTLYAALVFLAAIPPTTFFAGKLMEAGRRHQAPHFVDRQLAFIERDLERGWQGPPSEADLQALSEALPVPHRLRFVAWDAPGVPPELDTVERLVDDTPGHERPEHWVRIDRDGRPVGAVAMTPQWRPPGGRPFGGPPGPRPPGPFGPQMAWVWLLLLMLIIVPPIYLWVLRPLREMVGVAHRLGSGDLDTPVAVSRKDEFGELERAFEHMRTELKLAVEQRERLLTDVSHEIRAPLARMMIALPLLRKEGAPGPVTEIFEAELRHVDDLLGEVLALARAGYQPMFAPERLDLAEIARGLAADWAHFAEQGQRTVTLALAPVAVMGDRRLLTRAVSNLLDNALKYTSPGGQVRLVTRLEGGQAVLVVEDDGPGIAPSDMAMIFEPFYRPDTSRSRETGGAGLGLSIVKRIAEAHGGEVALRPRPEGGTLAELTLPAAG